MLAAGTAAFTQSFQVSLGMNKGPTQPINFSHKIHAGTLQMDCLYCHYAAEKSASANIPTVTTCMGCHKVAAVDRPEIQKLTKIYSEGRSPEWVEVYRLPDHVKFNHKRHVKADIKCQDCHGPVQEMAVMYQYPSLKMGWCLKCHRERLNDPKNPATMDCIVCHH
jgi:hypothetical protein